jgi:hypothetical protein
VSGFLADLWQQGVVLRLSADRARIVAPRHRLPAESRARLAQNEREILRLLVCAEEYRALIRNAFAIMLEHASSQQGLRELADDQARLTDELGPALATAIRDDEARQWQRETGLCPVCGDEETCGLCEEAPEA